MISMSAGLIRRRYCEVSTPSCGVPEGRGMINAEGILARVSSHMNDKRVSPAEYTCELCGMEKKGYFVNIFSHLMCGMCFKHLANDSQFRNVVHDLGYNKDRFPEQ